MGNVRNDIENYEKLTPIIQNLIKGYENGSYKFLIYPGKFVKFEASKDQEVKNSEYESIGIYLLPEDNNGYFKETKDLFTSFIDFSQAAIIMKYFKETLKEPFLKEREVSIDTKKGIIDIVEFNSNMDYLQSTYLQNWISNNKSKLYKSMAFFNEHPNLAKILHILMMPTLNVLYKMDPDNENKLSKVIVSHSNYDLSVLKFIERFEEELSDKEKKLFEKIKEYFPKLAAYRNFASQKEYENVIKLQSKIVKNKLKGYKFDGVTVYPEHPLLPWYSPRRVMEIKVEK